MAAPPVGHTPKYHSSLGVDDQLGAHLLQGLPHELGLVGQEHAWSVERSEDRHRTVGAPSEHPRPELLVHRRDLGQYRAVLRLNKDEILARLAEVVLEELAVVSVELVVISVAAAAEPAA